MKRETPAEQELIIVEDRFVAADSIPDDMVVVNEKLVLTFTAFDDIKMAGCYVFPVKLKDYKISTNMTPLRANDLKNFKTDGSIEKLSHMVGFDLPSLLLMIHLSSRRVSSDDYEMAGSVRLAAWILMEVIKGAVDDARCNPKLVTPNQEFIADLAEYQATAKRHAILDSDDEQRAVLNNVANIGCYSGSCFALWCQCLKIDPEWLSDLAFQLINAHAEEALNKPGPPANDNSDSADFYIADAIALFENLPLHFRYDTIGRGLKRAKTKTASEQTDLFMTA